ncbi:MAG: cytochrome C biogenesis protein [Chloroflexota bacterium]
MIADLGLWATALAFACAVYAVAASLYGARRSQPVWVESARNAAVAVLPLLTLASLTVIVSLVRGDFHLAYVVNTSNRAMPTFLKVTALWGGQNGSILFWSWLMSAFAFGVMLRKWDRDRELMPYVIAVTMITQAFFIGLVLFFANPFAKYWELPSGDIVSAVLPPAGALPFRAADGNGLNPLLRHPGMIAHPPMLYLGFVGFTIPYAFAIAALLAGGYRSDAWIRTTRRWTLAAWLFLSLGLLLGGRWAYDVLGWGGYWGWDPVENAAFLPWLTGTAFLHSVMIQEKRGMLKVWNMVLIILTYCLVILGTFITRTGVISSVHAFARSEIGVPFFIFVGAALVGSVALLISRLEGLKGENQLDSLLSREAAFLLNNLLFMGITLAVFWGTFFPIFSELFTGTKITVGPPFYNRVTGPQFAALVLLMGVGPLIAWRRASAKALGRLLWLPTASALLLAVLLVLLGVGIPGAVVGFAIAEFTAAATLSEFWRGARARQRSSGEPFLTALSRLIGRNRRRYGGYLIHLGVVLIAIGVVGSHFFQKESQATLGRGESMSIAGYTFVYEGFREVSPKPGDDLVRDIAAVGLYRDGRRLATLEPQREFYQTTQETLTPPALYGGRMGLEDIYLLLVGWEQAGLASASFKVYINPLVNFIWLGGVVFILGTLVAAWPNPAEERLLTPAAERRLALGEV